MHITNLISIDLNLLVELKMLLDEKHMSRAAKRIGLSQSAMGHALDLPFFSLPADNLYVCSLLISLY